jgi:hypothetical protein
MVGQAGAATSGDRSRRHTVGDQWQSRVSLRYRRPAWQAITQTTQPKTHNGRWPSAATWRKARWPSWP